MAVQPGPGMMIAVVGASGVGKDSLINLARAHYRDHTRIGFVQRTITRPVDGETEDHDPASLEQFQWMESQGRFAVTWGAHGLRYGIPAATLDDVRAGRILIANGSRAALDDFRAAYPDLGVIEITARPDVIAERLAQRGRESADEIALRLKRKTGEWRPNCLFERVDNSGALDAAAARLCEVIEEFAAGSAPD